MSKLVKDGAPYEGLRTAVHEAQLHGFLTGMWGNIQVIRPDVGRARTVPACKLDADISALSFDKLKLDVCVAHPLRDKFPLLCV